MIIKKRSAARRLQRVVHAASRRAHADEAHRRARIRSDIQKRLQLIEEQIKAIEKKEEPYDRYRKKIGDR